MWGAPAQIVGAYAAAPADRALETAFHRHLSAHTGIGGWEVGAF